MNRIPTFSGDRDLVLRLTRPRPIAGLLEAAADFGLTASVSRGLSVQIRTRYAVDISDRNNEWFLSEINDPESGIGHAILEDLVIAALCPFRPMDVYDEEGNVLTMCPILFADGSEYENEFKTIPPDDPTWGSSQLGFPPGLRPDHRPATRGRGVIHGEQYPPLALVLDLGTRPARHPVLRR